MHGGHYVAQNIHKSILKERCGQEPTFMEFRLEIPPMIGLAVGKKAVASGPEGTVFGEDELDLRDILGTVEHSALLDYGSQIYSWW